jgi:hypothetical protein
MPEQFRKDPRRAMADLPGEVGADLSEPLEPLEHLPEGGLRILFQPQEDPPRIPWPVLPSIPGVKDPVPIGEAPRELVHRIVQYLEGHDHLDELRVPAPVTRGDTGPRHADADLAEPPEVL